jgi:hypothetical protein
MVRILSVVLCACTSSLEPNFLAVRVFDASTGAPLCDASVSVDEMTATSGADVVSCYFVSQDLSASAGGDVTVHVARMGFQTAGPIVPIHSNDSESMELIVKLLPN